MSFDTLTPLDYVIFCLLPAKGKQWRPYLSSEGIKTREGKEEKTIWWGDV
jgi:hypothetical protein